MGDEQNFINGDFVYSKVQQKKGATVLVWVGLYPTWAFVPIGHWLGALFPSIKRGCKRERRMLSWSLRGVPVGCFSLTCC